MQADPAYLDALLECYEDEHYGRAMFEALAKYSGDEAVKQKCLRLAVLEERTYKAMAPLVIEKYALKPGIAAQEQKGRDKGAEYAGWAWQAVMRKFNEDAKADLKRMRAIPAMAPADRDDHKVLDVLIRHEEALAAFIGVELAQAPQSLEPVDAFIRRLNS